MTAHCCNHLSQRNSEMGVHFNREMGLPHWVNWLVSLLEERVVAWEVFPWVRTLPKLYIRSDEQRDA